jgi:hypothetical protein
MTDKDDLESKTPREIVDVITAEIEALNELKEHFEELDKQDFIRDQILEKERYQTDVASEIVFEKVLDSIRGICTLIAIQNGETEVYNYEYLDYVANEREMSIIKNLIGHLQSKLDDYFE